MSEPTMGEVLRRLDEVSRQLLDLARELKQDRAEAAATYVRQDVYFAERRAGEATVADLHGDIKKVETNLGREIGGIKTDRKNDVAFRRQIWLAVGTLSVTLVVTIVLAVINLLAR